MIWFLLIAFALLVAVKLFSGESKKTSTSVVDNYTQRQDKLESFPSKPLTVYDNRDGEEELRRSIREMQRKKVEELKNNMTPGKARQLRKRAEDLFSDEAPWSTDFSHLTPEQAQKKLEQMKARDGWVSDEDYRGLRKAINGYTTIKIIPPAVLALGPQEVEEWFSDAYKKGVSDKVFKKVASILKPYHEEGLLKLIENLSDNDLLVDWMREKKKQGKFFSDKAYEALRRKWLSQYDLEYSLND